MGKYIADLITTSRILGSIVLLFFPIFSFEFYCLYCYCGFSDMIDGMIARKTNTVTSFGSYLDSVADLAFVIIVFIKFLPAVTFPDWILGVIAVIAVIKLINLIFEFVYIGKVMFEHTIMNKITGFLLFLLPLTITFIELKYSASVVCIVALISAICESYYICKKVK